MGFGGSSATTTSLLPDPNVDNHILFDERGERPLGLWADLRNCHRCEQLLADAGACGEERFSDALFLVGQGSCDTPQ